MFLIFYNTTNIVEEYDSQLVYWIRVRQGPNTLYGGWCTQRKQSSTFEPLQTRMFVVHFATKIGLILVHTYPAKSTFIFNHTYKKMIGGLGKVLIHYSLWIETIIIPTHHYFGCNCRLPLFSKISHKKKSRTVVKIITVGWFMLQNKIWHVFSHKYS